MLPGKEEGSRSAAPWLLSLWPTSSTSGPPPSSPGCIGRGPRPQVEGLPARDPAQATLTWAAVLSRGPTPAQSHLGQQDEELLLAKRLGAAGTHAPLRRHGPAAPGLADLPLLSDQATGQCRHSAPGGRHPQAGRLPERPGLPQRSPLTRACSGPNPPPHPQDPRPSPHNRRLPHPGPCSSSSSLCTAQLTSPMNCVRQ